MSDFQKMFLSGRATVLSVVFLLSLDAIISASPRRDSKEHETLLSYCLDGMHHKSAPGPEASLYDQCSPWKERSCCTLNTTERIHNLTLYRFNYSQCQPLSESCKKYLIRDICFYECSPNIGPWVEKVEGMKIRKEQYKNVPLCKADCDSWYDACKNDYVCKRNWIKGGHKCAKESKCATVEDTYGNPKNFCEEIWNYSWKYTPDDEPCMKMWFDPSQGNPNDVVTYAKLDQKPIATDKLNRTGILVVFVSIVSITLIIVFILIRKDCLLIHNLKFRRMS